MTAPTDKGKKAKTDADGGEENEQIDGALVHSIEKLQEIQDELEKVNEEASDKVLEVEQKYSEIRRPTYLRRSDDYEDEQGEYAARKYCLESSPICSTKKNYGQLGINTHRSLRHGGQRKPISVDKMYSSKPCSTTLSGHQHRIHAIDPEEADNEKCRQNENNNSTYSTKRRKSEHQDSSLFCFQKGTKDDISMEIETWYDLALLYLSISIYHSGGMQRVAYRR